MARRKIYALAAAGVVGAALIAAPTTATAALLKAEGSGECVVDSAQLNWGVKESFRSYISGSIANGEWTVSDDMAYETPSFIWTESEGTFAGDLSEGTVQFTGAVHFTGHDGALEFDLADPGIEFDGEDAAYLLLTIGATDTANEGGVAQGEQVRAAKIDLAGFIETSETQLDINGAVPRLTSEGAAAFNGDYGNYVSGDELDPIVFTATVSGCSLVAAEAAVVEEPPVEEEQEAVATSAPEQSIPWLPIGIGAVALLVIGVTSGMLIAGRKKKPAAQAEPQARRSGSHADDGSIDSLFGDQNK